MKRLMFSIILFGFLPILSMDHEKVNIPYKSAWMPYIASTLERAKQSFVSQSRTSQIWAGLTISIIAGGSLLGWRWYLNFKKPVDLCTHSADENEKEQCSFVQKTLQSLPAGVKAEVLSTKPPIILLHNFVTDEEAEQIKQLAAARMAASKTGTGTGKQSNVRTSSSAFFHFEEGASIKNVVQRAAQIVGYTANHSEFQVVHYLPGQQFKPHVDWFNPNEKQWGTQRNISFFIYLNSVPKSEGGETHFPIVDLAVQPEKGAALLWSNIDAEGKEDFRVLHAGCVLKNGEKWGANLFFHDKVPYVNKIPFKYFFTINGAIQSIMNKFKRS